MKRIRAFLIDIFNLNRAGVLSVTDPKRTCGLRANPADKTLSLMAQVELDSHWPHQIQPEADLIKGECLVMTQKFRSRLFLKWTICLGICTTTLSACSQQGESNRPTFTQRYDIELESVSFSQCLNLASLYAQMRLLSHDNVFRRHTIQFALNDATRGGAVVRRNFTALASYSNFIFEESPSPIFSRDLPDVTQSDCTQIEINSPIEGLSRIQVVAENNPRQITVQYDENHSVTYALLDKRKLQIISKGLAQDPCPNYPQTSFTRLEEINWGPQGELDSTELFLDRSYLKNIAISVPQLPPNLAAANTYDTSEMISVSAMDLRSVKNTQVDSAILKCPFSSSAPSEEDSTPTIASDLENELSQFISPTGLMP